ncbi:hypothetical protein D9M71_536960 [compost metagenome]
MRDGRALPRQGMVSPTEDGRGQRGQMHRSEAWIESPVDSHGGHHELDVFQFQTLGQVMPVVDLDVHHELGCAPSQRHQHVGDGEVGRHHTDTEAQLAPLSPGNVIGLRDQFAGAAKQFTRPRNQLMAGRGQRH